MVPTIVVETQNKRFRNRKTSRCSIFSFVWSSQALKRVHVHILIDRIESIVVDDDQYLDKTVFPSLISSF